MKFLLEVLTDDDAPKGLPLNGPVEGRTLLVLSEDGESMTPCAVRVPQLEVIPRVSVVRITRQD
jgi:hypothetical protein